VKTAAKTHIDLLLERRIFAFEKDFLQWRSRFLHDKKLLQQWQKCTRSGWFQMLRPNLTQTLFHLQTFD
jgi:hypothetical protein